MKFLVLLLTLTSICFAGPFRGPSQVADYVYDFSVSGGATGTVSVPALQNSLPVSAVVTGLTFQVISPLTSSGAATLTFGNTASATAYIPSLAYTAYSSHATKDSKSYGNNAISNGVYLLDGSTKRDLLMTIGTQPLTGGKVYFRFSYFVPGLY